MGLLSGILVAAALAQAPASAEEITVWGEPAVRQLRSAVVRDLEGLGYRAVDKPAGRVLFKPPERWMGRVWLEADGSLTHLRPVVAFKRADGVSWDALDEPPFERTPAGTASGAAAAGQAAFFVLPAERILEPQRERVEAAAAESLEALQTTVRETTFRLALQAIPDRLDALWGAGTPLVAGDPSVPPAERKAAVLAFWSSRAETREGELVAEAVARWIRGTLQGTESAVTPDEASAAEQQAPGRSLGLK